ncbi:phage repressor protein/antirepressor Ant [Salmonella enterica]|uniref:Phage repressor protein/antirepressor Ant n=3 Tax=Enterobacteriaceae TaxID=543 RepID=A0A5X4TIN4_SALHA|nr:MULTISPECIES: P22AR C-terminal domain-containing protein [Enterobacteriaceae]EAA7286497.1 phage repressor protein/antirepressor Ant [Salmonella enterica subsp. enterica serovar Newport]EBL5629172.1 phage repressor protein/antirepressor Ant [Salmonella enterica subsp. enterica serovar Kentucky]ECU5753333.1 phage repressor protein/antirepressor Ant [Salmonella enterica subsp. enterica serovar Typhimurium var. 5-]ECV3715457.1 phage repressor protein/antirepressor Ant [Salmonella enterica subsp.
MKSIAKAQNDFTIFKFGDSEIRVINKCGEPWFVAKDVCDALALTNSRKALTALDDDEKGVTLSYTLGGEQNLSIVSESGMYTLVLRCRDAVNKGSVPHKFRKWVTAEVLPSIRKHGEYVKGKKTTVEERTPLRDAVNMLVGKKGLRYDDAYNMVHQRFGIDSIDELSIEQIPLAVEYIHRVVLEGEFIGKQEKKTDELSAKEANSLVWLWDYANRSQALFRELYPALKQIQSNYSGRCHDCGYEFSRIIDMARDVLINHTRDVDINEPDGPTNLSAWMRLKNKELPPSVHNY